MDEAGRVEQCSVVFMVSELGTLAEGQVLNEKCDGQSDVAHEGHGGEMREIDGQVA